MHGPSPTISIAQEMTRGSINDLGFVSFLPEEYSFSQPGAVLFFGFPKVASLHHSSDG